MACPRPGTNSTKIRDDSCFPAGNSEKILQLGQQIIEPVDEIDRVIQLFAHTEN